MPYNWGNASNLRYNPFTGIFTPLAIAGESHIIPLIAPYHIYLYESPKFDDPSTVIITIGGVTLTEVPFSQVPANNQYRVCYQALGNGIIEFNANQAGQTALISYYGLGTLLSTQSITRNNGIPSVIVASSNSNTASQIMADYLIPVANDAGAVFNTAMTALTALGGGKLLVAEGTYNCTTTITMQSNITIEGTGYNTLFKRMANTTKVFDCTSAMYIILKNFLVDGNKASYATACSLIYQSVLTNFHLELYLINSSQYGFFNSSNLKNSIVSGCTTAGIKLGYRVSGCKIHDNGIGVDTGWIYSDCDIYDNTTIGISAVDQINNCIVQNNGTIGVSACTQISNILSQDNLGNGFDSCIGVINCNSKSNGVAGTVYGYYACKKMQQNKGSLNRTATYNTCYADSATSNVVSDTSAGGYNS